MIRPSTPKTRGLTLEYTVNPPTRQILVKWSLKRFGLEDLLGHPIALLVVYLWRGDRQTFADRLRTEVADFEEEFRFPTVKIWECRARILSGELRELAPLLVLCDDEPTVATLEAARALLLDPAMPAEKRPLLIGATMAVALRHHALELVQQIFQQEASMLRDIPLIQDWLAQENADGKIAGRAEGAAEQLRKVIRQLGEARFGKPTAAVRERLEDLTDLAELERLTDRLLQVETWSELLR